MISDCFFSHKDMVLDDLRGMDDTMMDVRKQGESDLFTSAGDMQLVGKEGDGLVPSPEHNMEQEDPQQAEIMEVNDLIEDEDEDEEDRPVQLGRSATQRKKRSRINDLSGASLELLLNSQA